MDYGRGRPGKLAAAQRRTSEAPTGSKQPHDEEQHDRTDRGIDDLRYKPRAEMNAEFRKQETGEQAAADADENITDDAEPGATHNLSGQPAGHQADEQDDQNAFIGHTHQINSPCFSHPPRRVSRRVSSLAELPELTT